MHSDHPLADPRWDNLFQQFCELIDDKHELYLLIAFIRMFREVKTEYDEKYPNLKIVKRKGSQPRREPSL